MEGLGRTVRAVVVSVLAGAAAAGVAMAMLWQVGQHVAATVGGR